MKKNKANIYEVGFNLYSLIDEDYPENGIKNAAKYVKKVLKADELLLFRKNKESKDYDTIFASSELFYPEIKEIVKMYNKNRKNDFDTKINGNVIIERLMILNIPVNDKLVTLVATNGINIDNNKQLIKIIKNGLGKHLSIEDKINILKKSSNTDKLTFINNRTCYEEDRIRLYKGRKKIITFVMIDLFRLKHINDTYSHIKGDKYIIETARILAETFNDEKSKVYRFGGDEFTVVIEGYDIVDLDEKIAIAQERVSNIDLGLDNEQTMMNVGVAVGTSRDIDKLYDSADYQMKENKENMYQLLKVRRV